ncbi:MAG: DUF3500 domain-containing protein [Verrucomicrobiota bacterium]
MRDHAPPPPLFIGPEPIRATADKPAGMAVLQKERDQGLAFINPLSSEQRHQAILSPEEPGINFFIANSMRIIMVMSRTRLWAQLS